MSDRLVIIGAGGHGKVIADIGVKAGYEEIIFLDDRAEGTCLGFPIVGTSVDIPSLNDGKAKFVIAIGSNEVRREMSQQWQLPWATLIHPSAQIGLQTKIGPGTVVMARAVINAGAKLGAHCIVNSGAIVEHDCCLGDYVHISPNAALGGTVTIGEGTHVGIGAAVKNNVTICPGCTIGAGASVVKNLEIQGCYVGTPARIQVINR